MQNTSELSCFCRPRALVVVVAACVATANAASPIAKSGRYTLGPNYTADPATKPCLPCDGDEATLLAVKRSIKQKAPCCCHPGTSFSFTMPMANTSYNCLLKDNPSLSKNCTPYCGQEWGTPGTRNISLYVPASYKDGDEAAVMVTQDGETWVDSGGELIKNTMDNLIGNTDPARSLPTFVWLSVQVAGLWSGAGFFPPYTQCGDGPGSERNNEYATVSDKYAKFISEEVIPFVVNHKDVKSQYPNFRITSNPAGRATLGCSKGGAEAFAMAFFRPDLFGIAIGYSAGFYHEDTTLTSNMTYPLGMAEMWVPSPEGLELIKNRPHQPIRVFHNANQNDFGTPGSCLINPNHLGNLSGFPPWPPGKPYVNFLEANNKVQDALEEKHYTTRYAYGGGWQCHCQKDIIFEDFPNTLVWAWSSWRSHQLLQKSDDTQRETGDDRTFGGIPPGADGTAFLQLNPEL